MEIFNNTTKIVKDDLVQTLVPHSRISIAAACFSIYAYQELKKQLNSIESLHFIFTSPTFISEKSSKEQREFYIPRLYREKSLYGTKFEVKLRNEMTQKAIARECGEWIRKKVTFKSNLTQRDMEGFLNIQSNNQELTYYPIKGFTSTDIGCDKGNNIYNMVNKFDAPFSKEYIKLFNDIWNDDSLLQNVTDDIIENISSVYKENSAELIYFFTLYNIFNTFLNNISEDVLPNEATGFKDSVIWNKLFNFQKDAALGIINKLEMYNGCILADSVGLGKTYTALAVIKYYETRNKSTLVLCPKKLAENWKLYSTYYNYKNNPLNKDRLNYMVLYHTDLSRQHGESNGFNFENSNWSNYDLIVIDESHNFRNGGERYGENNEKENRYLKLLNKVIRPGVKTKVLMLSATPVNNRFYDLRNQLALAYEGKSQLINDKLHTKHDIDTIFRQAQKVYNSWSKQPADQRTTNSLQKQLNIDFFELLDSVTIARSRKQIQHYYDTSEIGSFPKRNPPISLRPKLTTLNNAINYEQVYDELEKLNLSIYTPTKYIHSSKLSKYIDLDDNHSNRLSQSGREKGIFRLMSINLLKRMESSVHSFTLTVKRIYNSISDTINLIDRYQSNGNINVKSIENYDNFDFDDQNSDLFTVGKSFKIDLRDMDYISWRRDLNKDQEVLELLLLMVEDITPEYDYKLNQLKHIIDKKIQNPINPGNKKILIFTAFSDTAEYLYNNASSYAKKKFGLNTALITGTIEGKTTISKFPNDMNTILTCFSPNSKEKSLVMPNDHNDIDILIATDCISEGQNLQDCDYCINYDIHWNPVRIIQRFGRIDRIGSKNKEIQLVNFWPDLELDDYINLKSRVETRMKISVLTATGDDDYINSDENGDLSYRREQLKKLKNEVVDLEDMANGISIMDLGLNDFRMDLLNYVKGHPNLDRTPLGINAVVKGEKPGVIFVLKNLNNAVNIENQNRIHPFYMVYIGDSGEVISNHLQPKETLDIMRQLSLGKKVPDYDVCHIFNKETKDGKKMDRISNLLQKAISSIISVNDENDLDSFFGNGQTTFLTDNISGLNDFELICFMVVI